MPPVNSLVCCRGRIQTQVFLISQPMLLFLPYFIHPHSMEFLINQASADWDKGKHPFISASWKHYLSDDSSAHDHYPDLKPSMAQHYLKRECKAYIREPKPHRQPSSHLIYPFSKALCAPNSLLRHFWPQSAHLHIGVPLVISFALALD